MEKTSEQNPAETLWIRRVLASGSRPISSTFAYELAIAESSQKPEPEHAAEDVKRVRVVHPVELITIIHNMYFAVVCHLISPGFNFPCGSPRSAGGKGTPFVFAALLP